MTDYLGLTWDHPRGRNALEATAATFSAESADTLTWSAQPLEGFESTPIDELAAQYDLIVLDHPHIGDAIAAECLIPLDELYAPEMLSAWSRAAVGPTFDSYVVEGRSWALPLDAATQVSARRPSEVPDAPLEWSEALELARHGGVAPSLAGPHAFLSLCSIAVSLGADPAATEEFLPAPIFDEAVQLLGEFAARAPQGTSELNPIGLLERMSTVRDIHYVPLVYGYAPYSMLEGDARIAFGSPPRASGRVGATLGGTGIAVSRRCSPSTALLDHIAWLMSDETQRRVIPAHQGQPSARTAWTDTEVDDAAGGFYSGTLDALEHSWVRPRFAGYVPVQTEASRLIRQAIEGSITQRAAHDRVAEAFSRAHASSKTGATS